MPIVGFVDEGVIGRSRVKHISDALNRQVGVGLGRCPASLSSYGGWLMARPYDLRVKVVLALRRSAMHGGYA